MSKRWTQVAMLGVIGAVSSCGTHGPPLTSCMEICTSGTFTACGDVQASCSLNGVEVSHIDCGTCSAGLTCVQNRCQSANCATPDAATTATFCAMKGFECGGANFPCTTPAGTTTPVDCGTCAGGRTCGSFHTCGTPSIGAVDVNVDPSLSASFFTYTPGNEMVAKSTVGPCAITTTTFNGTPMLGTTTYSESGTITATGSGGMISAMPMGTTDTYYASNTNAPLAASGAMVTISSTGGAVPAVPATQVVAGAPVTLTTTFANNQTVPRSSDLAIAFTGGATGSFIVTLFQQSGAANQILASCSFPANSSPATIPTAALQQLGTGMTILRFDNKTSSSLQVGSYGVTVTLHAGVTGSPQYQIVLQ